MTEKSEAANESGGNATEIVERWRSGDQNAATELYELYCERLIRIVAGKIGDGFQQQVEPEDVLQTAFRTWFRRVREGEFHFEDDGDVWKLLLTVVLNRLRRGVRFATADKRDIRRQSSVDSEFDGELASHLTRKPSDHEALEFADLMTKVLKFLSPSERDLIQLRIEGYNQKESAEELGVDVRTIRRMWKRIGDQVKMLLSPDED